MTLQSEPCQLVPIWLMKLPLEHCYTGGVFVVAKFRGKKDSQNLTLMTLDREPCHLVPIWLMALHLEPSHTGGVCMVAK